MILNILQLPPELSRDEIERIPDLQPTTEEIKEQELLQWAPRLSVEAGKIMAILSFLSFSLLKVKLIRRKLMLGHRKGS